ncbi:RibD family protein [Mucilaginibacter celer]|uniref:RibD family protein n=1 Tax=Mucilaginibacter celer TaxID=2305508 RepID=A0A494W4F0_9SPHI|nr:RibD family protein [Mucilaginibacter celer]AYL98418.1 RibD family protein [Mucilaginibacter celer]
MKKRPYVICLMMTSVDGKILTEQWGNAPAITKLLKNFEDTHETFGIGAWIVGRATMEKDFTKGASPVLKKGHQEVSREDFVAGHQSETFAIAIDAQGKLGWKKATMHGDHVITILTTQVEDAYLAHLQDIGLSYIFAGEKGIDLAIALEKLYTLFNIEKLMLEGGGHINGSFLNEGLIDEFHQLLLPIADGTAQTATVFDIDEKAKRGGATLLQLEDVKKLDDDVLWLKYKVSKS